MIIYPNTKATGIILYWNYLRTYIDKQHIGVQIRLSLYLVEINWYIPYWNTKWSKVK